MQTDNLETSRNTCRQTNLKQAEMYTKRQKRATYVHEFVEREEGGKDSSNS